MKLLIRFQVLAAVLIPIAISLSFMLANDYFISELKLLNSVYGIHLVWNPLQIIQPSSGAFICPLATFPVNFGVVSVLSWHFHSFTVLTSTRTYVLGSWCLSLSICICICICVCRCICRSACRTVCSRGVYVMWQLLASLLSHNCNFVYLSIFPQLDAPFSPSHTLTHSLLPPPPNGTSCTILLRFALHFVDSFVNKRWKLAKYKYMYPSSFRLSHCVQEYLLQRQQLVRIAIYL